MNSPPTRSAWRYEQMLRIALAGWLLLCLAFFVISTLHWPEVNDPAQITYLAFLMDHGFTPYKYLLEMNMPGIYLVNWSVMHLLGSGSLAWRVFDLSLVAASIVAMLFIARTYDWVGGLFAGILFALFHGHDGPAEQGQRDFIIAILLVCAYAFLFEAMRRQRYWLLFFFGACAGAAATIKPPALVFALFLITVVCWRLRAQPRAVLQAAVYSVAGMLLPLAIVFAFLLKKGAVHAFFEISHILLPYYATLGRRPLGFLIARSFTPSIAMLLCFGVAMGLLQWRGWNWERKLLLAGIAFGAFSEYAQGKGWLYHRYPMVIFILLWVGIEAFVALRHKGVARMLACTCLLFGAVVALLSAKEAVHREWDEAFNQSLTANLTNLGGPRLSNSVLCVTMPADCATTLYRMRLVQSTGLIYDYLIFGDSRSSAIQWSRARFWPQLIAAHPRVIILGRFLYPYADDNYDKLNKWPQFTNYLNVHYSLYDDKRFPVALSGIRGYRIYVRKDGGA